MTRTGTTGLPATARRPGAASRERNLTDTSGAGNSDWAGTATGAAVPGVGGKVEALLAAPYPALLALLLFLFLLGVNVARAIVAVLMALFAGV
ncbi:MAG: hypothetical protein M3Z20_05315 [Chloroflexota bacterium]|nr:hypothetical protein [Chloroflexota bacterium]